jgi:YHS domain-containing protein
MKPRRPTRRVCSVALLAFLVAVGFEAVDVALAHDHHDEDRPETAIADTTLTDAPNDFCPVLTGRKVNPAIHATHDGREVYFCCAMCRRKFLADPGAYLATLLPFGDAEPPDHPAHDSTIAGRRAPVAVSSRNDQPSAGLLARFGALLVHGHGPFLFSSGGS